MELSRNIRKARELISSFRGEEENRLLKICDEIKLAQHCLNQAAAGYFADCMRRCGGICCRNIRVSDILTLLDFVFILAVNPELTCQVADLSRKETLFSADCLFLRNGTGPCIFAPDAKPERCIVTFCSSVGPVKKEIRTVGRNFSKLWRHLMIRRPVSWFGFR